LTSELHLDALIDTGATYCIIPPSTARVLGFNSGNRVGRERVTTVGGQIEMEMHWLEHLKVGSAQAYRVQFGVYNTLPGARFIIVGLTFMKRFRTIFDFDEGRVLFRARNVKPSTGFV
jgi:predicted aspartyl protease